MLAQFLCAAVALNTRYQQNILLLFMELTGGLSYSCINALGERGINTVARSEIVIAAVTHCY